MIAKPAKPAKTPIISSNNNTPLFQYPGGIQPGKQPVKVIENPSEKRLYFTKPWWISFSWHLEDRG